jgi:SAM-dependent methyltransferase
MSDSEFGKQAAEIAVRVERLPRDQQIAAACRGSGNPAALAWIAENLRLTDASTVVDLGAGLGGASAWLRSRYRCSVVGVEPEEQAARGARSIFSIPMVVATAHPAPFAARTFDAALLLGVVSVVADPESVLEEAGRISAALGLLDYCSTNNDPVSVGGSQFSTESHLRRMVTAAGWHVEQCVHVAVDTPDTWARASEYANALWNPDEAEVARAIEDGLIAPIMLVAHR